ncbi:MAG: DUF2974 domain-containing protein [Spirochaetales bacterium]|uniref:DUF2974 domain-containing protein n=1 Tax=Candidatus Thalassospirochaeta sargassi TaxID=3119039 RepID=A0AAJ1IFN9_9SPIO|nr:DUF2974 domain-containing protein [Spirochaetales bacterium]
MANILDYIQWRGDLAFSADPFNEVDNLILARLSYIDFDDLDSRGEELDSISRRYIHSETRMNPGLMLNEGTKPLLETAGDSSRFGSLFVRAFINKIDFDNQLQFSAVVFELDRKTAYIAFRGTDDTLVGWKEDFNMSFMDVVPAQLEAASYLNDVVSKYGYRKIYVGGHSKGGNLAVYASVHLKKRLKRCIETVYNNDGPGFGSNLLETAEYQEISGRITTLIPKSSVVGLLLEHEEQYRVVESSQKGIMQHDGLSWEVKGKDFVYLPELKDDARIFDKTTKSVLKKLSLEQRAAFSTVLFDLLSVNDSKTLTELNNGGLSNFFKMSENYSKLDREMKKLIFDTLSLFFGESFKSFLDVSGLNQWQNKMKLWREETRDEIESFFRKL